MEWCRRLFKPNKLYKYKSLMLERRLCVTCISFITVSIHLQAYTNFLSFKGTFEFHVLKIGDLTNPHK